LLTNWRQEEKTKWKKVKFQCSGKMQALAKPSGFN